MSNKTIDDIIEELEIRFDWLVAKADEVFPR
jgi:hypothetical protein